MGLNVPFCQADTITEQLAKNIRDYFDESYQNSIIEIKSIQTRYTSIVESIPKLDDYKNSQFSSGYLAQLNEHHAQLSKDAEANLELIKQKVSNPSLQVTLHDISATVSAFNLVVESINKLIVTHNSKIDNSANELANIKTDFWKILRYEYDQTISNFNAIQSEAEKIITEKTKDETAKTELERTTNSDRVEHQKSTVNIDEAIININQGLTDIGITDFYIEKHEGDLYRLVRTDSHLKIFSSLSEGEKMIISLLYFRELFRGKQSATEGNVRKLQLLTILYPVCHISLFTI